MIAVDGKIYYFKHFMAYELLFRLDNNVPDTMGVAGHRRSLFDVFFPAGGGHGKPLYMYSNSATFQ